MLNPELVCIHIPFVHRYLVMVVSRMGKSVPKTALRSVLFPELWVPKMATLALEAGKEVRSGLHVVGVTW